MVIYQDVTIGIKERNISKDDKYPWICDKVCIYAGAKVVGAIKLEEGTIVGANAVMMQNSIKFGIYGGVPAKLLKISDKNNN